MKTTTITNEMLLAELVALRAEVAQLKGVKATSKAVKAEKPVANIACPPALLVACKTDPKQTPGKNGGMYYKCFATMIILSGQKKYGASALYAPATIKAAAVAYGITL